MFLGLLATLGAALFADNRGLFAYLAIKGILHALLEMKERSLWVVYFREGFLTFRLDSTDFN